MAFKIRQVGSTEEKVFTTKTILELLGDKTNDEITIQNEKYRLSSVVDLASDGATSSGLPVIDWQKVPLVPQVPNQVNFSVNIPVKDYQGIFLFVNGLLYDYGQDADFHLNSDGTILTWHGGVNLTPSDKIFVRYITVYYPEVAQ